MSRTAIKTAYRVYKFVPSQIELWRKIRDRRGVTDLAFITEATDTHLAPLVRELRAIGMTGQPMERCAVRLEVPMTTLADWATASEATGVPSTTLLSICLSRASATTRARRS